MNPCHFGEIRRDEFASAKNNTHELSKILRLFAKHFGSGRRHLSISRGDVLRAALGFVFR
jgi:hypothetical protein